MADRSSLGRSVTVIPNSHRANPALDRRAKKTTDAGGARHRDDTPKRYAESAAADRRDGSAGTHRKVAPELVVRESTRQIS